MMDFIRELFDPDDFAGDAYGWMTNEVSHAAFGLVVTWALAQGGLPLWMGVAGFLALEARQVARGAGLRDSVEDALFFSAGAAWLWLGGSWALLAAVLAALCSGVMRRV